MQGEKKWWRWWIMTADDFSSVNYNMNRSTPTKVTVIKQQPNLPTQLPQLQIQTFLHCICKSHRWKFCIGFVTSNHVMQVHTLKCATLPPHSRLSPVCRHWYECLEFPSCRNPFCSQQNFWDTGLLLRGSIYYRCNSVAQQLFPLR